MIPDIWKGKPLYAQDIKNLIDEVKTNRVTDINGGRLIRGINGTTIIIDKQQTGGGGVGDTTYHPFQVLRAPAEDNDDGKPYFYIYEESYLIRDASEREYIQITPINTAYERFALPEDLPAAIAVTLEFNEQMTVTSAYLEQSKIEDYFNDYPNPVVRDTEAEGFNYLRQTKMHIFLAEIVGTGDKRDGIVVDDEGVKKKIVQLVDTDLLFTWSVFDGLAAQIAVPWKRCSRAAGNAPWVPTPYPQNNQG
jgi:hypothetical protein